MFASNTNIHTCGDMHARTHTHTYIYTYIHTHLLSLSLHSLIVEVNLHTQHRCFSVCIYSRLCAHHDTDTRTIVYVCIYIYIYIYIYSAMFLSMHMLMHAECTHLRTVYNQGNDTHKCVCIYVYAAMFLSMHLLRLCTSGY